MSSVVAVGALNSLERHPMNDFCKNVVRLFDLTYTVTIVRHPSSGANAKEQRTAVGV